MKPLVRIFTTGGTIASAAADPDSSVDYEVSSGAAARLIAGVPAVARIARIEAEAVCSLGSHSIGLAQWKALARRIQDALDGPADGAVVLHGTDTMEETAFLLNMVLKTSKPVVLTGAMRPENALSADGPQNLVEAVSVAASPEARGHGVLAALNGAVIGANELQKTDTMALETFRARNGGPLGFVRGGRVTFVARTLKPHTLAAPFTADMLEAAERLPCVPVLYLTADQDAFLAEACLARPVDGLVLACTGHGSVSDPLEPVAAECVRRGIPVVRASRVGDGTVMFRHRRWAEAGILNAGMLNPQKARLLLQLALLKWGPDMARIGAAFGRFGG
ncbi:MAG: asparaginase [Duodenibacillus sp.]|nr:asparaginase [Duodenibacillus sp.]